ncbi:hypothetical protein [Sphingopyxis sp. 2PD]|uniref:hypothetical protein n=1 Tax=Sphingopyxis sp. 2PD TaxID=2502196 RepID=UPI0010F9C0E2|nr:hypothetical protein [Sphingopyxis sp. 2PD]
MTTNNGIDMVSVRVLPDNRVARREAAKLFGRTPKTLAEWTAKGWGPRPIMVGGRVFHDYGECLAMARGELPVAPVVREAA